ncbi:hypothetical protein [Geminisphaera colitermitum]|uniref:hypothetical protein n=1 Tax=Geminisphaera colitermitum TaxID=1148786 RepID=UPI000158C77B|nr:hypothetical protein [Geminisphaera colitermitum]
MNKNIILSLIMAFAATLPVSSIQAADKYWNANSPASGLWAGSNNWASTETGPANTGFTSASDSTIITQSGAIISLSSLSTVTTLGLEIRNGARITSGPTGNNALTLTGAGNGDLEWRGITAGTFSLTLGATTAWIGSITDTSTNATSRIVVSNVAAVSTSTKIALNGTGSFLLNTGTQGFTTTIGELSGNSTSAIIGLMNAGSNRVLRVDQSTNTTYAGRIITDASNRTIAFEKSGTGRLRLTGGTTDSASTWNNGTNVLAGELYINGVTSGQGTYTVSSGATLGGTGAIGLKTDATITVKDGGILNPGDISDLGIASTGTLTITGTSGAGLVFEGNATILFNLDGDKIVLNGDTLTGSAATGSIITFDFSGSSTSVVGSTIDLIDFGGTPGIDDTAFAASGDWTGNFKYHGNILQFEVVSAPIPEPSTVALALGLGTVLVVLFRRRR